MKQLCEIKKILSSIYRIENILKKDYNLTINEAICLCSLKEKPDTPGNIANEMGISLSRMSRVLSSLESKGFISRSISPEDRRKMYFELSDQGITKLQDLENTELPYTDILQFQT